MLGRTKKNLKTTKKLVKSLKRFRKHTHQPTSSQATGRRVSKHTNGQVLNDILQLLEDRGFYIARLVSGSKSFYRELHPKHAVLFNANIIDEKLGKIWHGDLDLTIDGKKLKDVASELNTTLYILSEMDGRFEHEGDSIDDFIAKAQWNTDMFVPIYDNHGKMVGISD